MSRGTLSSGDTPMITADGAYRAYRAGTLARTAAINVIRIALGVTDVAATEVLDCDESPLERCRATATTFDQPAKDATR